MKPRPEFLDTAVACGAVITGKPDGSEPITIVFTIDAWRRFDAVQRTAITREEVELVIAHIDEAADGDAERLIRELARAAGVPE